MSDFDHDPELFDLADDLCADNVRDENVADDMARLDAILSNDPEARKKYLRYMFLHADLMTRFSTAGNVPVVGDPVEGLPLHLFDRIFEGQPPEAGIDLSWPRRAMRERTVGDKRAASMGQRFGDWVGRFVDWAGTRSSRRRLSPAGLAVVLAILATMIAVPIILSGLSQPQPIAQNVPASLTVAFLSSSKDCQWADAGAGQGIGTYISANQTLHLLRGRAEVSFHNGAKTVLEGPVEFVIDTPTSGRLLSGSVTTRVPATARGFMVKTPSVQIVDLGTQFTTSVDQFGTTTVKVLDGEVEISPWTPKHYLNFDEPRGSFVDLATGGRAILGSTAQRTAGLIGPGGIRFNNAVNSAVYLGNGGASPQWRGSFSANDGLTIEAVFVSQWSGDEWEYDHLFRKEDGEQRMLLAFQNEPRNFRKAPAMPDTEGGPSLAFGLCLSGQGYHELDMPLDGREGRPTVMELTDGKPHHVAAIYEAATGRKSIYIDGRHCMTAYYPPGTPVVSGGHASAVVGSCTQMVLESFHGVIDEFAWYDFALSEAEIARHYEYVGQGKNYFGQDPHAASVLPKQIRLTAGQSMRFDGKTGLPAK